MKRSGDNTGGPHGNHPADSNADASSSNASNSRQMYGSARRDMLHENVIGQDGLERGNPATSSRRVAMAREAAATKQAHLNRMRESVDGNGNANANANANETVSVASGATEEPLFYSADEASSSAAGAASASASEDGVREDHVLAIDDVHFARQDEGEGEDEPLTSSPRENQNTAPEIDVDSRRDMVSRIMKRKNPFRNKRDVSLYEYAFDEHTNKVKPKLSVDLVLAINWRERRENLLARGYSERKVCSMIRNDVQQIVDGLLRHLDKVETHDMLTTDTDAFLYLYAEYDAFVADDSPIEERLVTYPHIVTVCQILAGLYSGTYDNDIATDLSAQALDLMVHYHVRKMMFMDEDDIWKQWTDVRKYAAQRRLSHSGKIEYLERFIQYIKDRQLREANVDISKRGFMKKIEKDFAKAKGDKFERITGVLLFFCLFFFITFIAARCYVESSCQSEPQNMTVLAHTFDFDPPVLGNAGIAPCQVSCTLFRPACTCKEEDLQCNSKEMGNVCYCTHLTCDRCNICGLLRKLFRENLILIFFLPAIFHLVLFFLSVAVVNFPSAPLSWSIEEDSEFYRIREANLEHMNVIIAHQIGSHHDLQRTVKAVLEIVRPGQIIVAHYGKTDVPFEDDGVDGILTMLADLSGKFYDVNPEESVGDSGKINYVWVGTESRTFAIYMTCIAKCTSKHVMILRDDCTLPRELFIPCNWFKEDEKVSAMSFFTRSDHLVEPDGSRNKVAVFQDMFAKKFGVSSVWQSYCGSMFWPSQYVTIWRREHLLHVLERHDCSMIGEAIEQGILMHKMHRANRIKCVANVPVPVAQPSHMMCWPMNTPAAKSGKQGFFSRLILAPFKCREWGCPHRAVSVFADVVRTTNAQYQYILPKLSVLLFVWNRNSFVLKTFILAEFLDILMDFLRIPLLYFIVTSQMYAYDLVFYLVSVYVIYVLISSAMEMWTFRERLELQSPYAYILGYPIYSFVRLIFRQIAAFYSLVYLIPKKRNSIRIINRLRLPMIVDDKHMSLDPDAIPEAPSRPEVAFYRNQLRHMEIYGMQRKEDRSWALMVWDAKGLCWTEERCVAEDEAKRQAVMREKDSSFLVLLLLIPILALAVYIALLDVELTLLLTGIFGVFMILMIVDRVAFQ